MNSGIFWDVPPGFTFYLCGFPSAAGSLLTLGLLVWWMTVWHYFSPERHWGPGCLCPGYETFLWVCLYRKRRQDEFNESTRSCWECRSSPECSTGPELRHSETAEKPRQLYRFCFSPEHFTLHTSSCNRNIYYLFAPVLEVTNGAPFIIFLVYNIQHFLFQSQSEIRDLNNNLSSHHSDHFGGMGGIIKMFYINFHVCYDTRILNLDTIIVLKQL